MGKADFHTHTFHSDGLLSPNALFIKVKSFGISTIAITDHDSIEHIPKEMELAKQYNLQFIPGCEVSAYQGGKDYHIVALNFVVDDPFFMEYFQNYNTERLKRAEIIIRKFNNLGINITLEDVLKEANNAPIVRPHIARVIAKKGYAKNVREVFSRFLYDNGPAYQPKITFPVRKAVELIQSAGGVAILAHPANFFTNQELERCVKDGIDGIEVYHPLHSGEQSKFYLEFAKKNNLLVSGGSDFHNPETDEKNLGRYSVTDLETELILQKSKKNRSKPLFKHIWSKLFSFF